MNHAEKMIDKAGGVEAVAASLGVTLQAVYSWRRSGYIPLARARAVAELAGVKPEVAAKRVIP